MSETAARLAGRDLTLCDAVSSLAEHSPVGIPGDEAFYEHVHLNFAGNYRLRSRWLMTSFHPFPQESHKP
jgi:hypothetical protein